MTETTPKSSSTSRRKSKKGSSYYAKTNENEAFKEYGEYLLDEMEKVDPEKRAIINSKSSTLHFVNLLGTASRRKSRSIKGYVFKDTDPNQDRYMDASKVIGVTLRSDEPLMIRQIDMSTVKKLITRGMSITLILKMTLWQKIYQYQLVKSFIFRCMSSSF